MAPIYDLVATRVYNMTPEMSFYIGGELDIAKINRKSFFKVADEIGMSSKMVMSIFDDMADKLEKALEDAAYELEGQGFEQAIFLKTDILKTGGFRNLS